MSRREPRAISMTGLDLGLGPTASRKMSRVEARRLVVTAGSGRCDRRLAPPTARPGLRRPGVQTRSALRATPEKTVSHCTDDLDDLAPEHDHTI